jgi:P4 family phage/plasmid primase-like protien
MSSNSQYKDLSVFLKQYTAKGENNPNNYPPTHTRIGDKDTKIYGGAYYIPAEQLPTFYKLYCDDIFNKKKMEFLTEKQLDGNGPILIDFDFRYNYDVSIRQHTPENIQDLIILYLEELKHFFVFQEGCVFNIFILEKPNINRVADKNITKDGIHIVIGIQMDHIMQTMLRENILKKIANIFENLPLTNNWESVLDEGITKGSTNWQLFGSRKPGNDAYQLTQHYVISYDKNDGEFSMDEKEVKKFNIFENFATLTAQNTENPKFEINPTIMGAYKQRVDIKNNKIKFSTNIKINKKVILCDENNTPIFNLENTIHSITNHETLKTAVDDFIGNLLPNESDIKEIHNYTMILPEKYYMSGSHILNRQVAFALKNTDERLFLTWILLRSKAVDFDFTTIPALYKDWNIYFNKTNGLTKRSIIYWAKHDAFEEYQKVKDTSIDGYIETTIFSQTDFDFAQVLYNSFKDKYVCTSIQNKSWYVFKQHRWEIDKGMTLRLAISKDMFSLFQSKLVKCTTEMQGLEAESDAYQLLSKKCKALATISLKLKQTNDKNNIMREAMELFYDKNFIKQMDGNEYLLCFNNGVIDFTTRTFRVGNPQDYITKSTGIDYVPYDENNPMNYDIISFMEKLFPIPSLNEYMWQHLSSCLIGANLNQTFNIYRGSGSNGKSILTDLMSQCLGELKGTVPITLVSEKRNNIGGTSSEIMQLKGIRYAVMQEPSKDCKINEGVMKELTGGDPLQGRALYCDSEVFIPQFKLVVCTNSLFEIKSNDDGTWRRIRICDFMSKFTDTDEQHKDNTPYVFPKDKHLKEKLPLWAPIFMSMLVDRAFKTGGIVTDSDVVLKASNKYRQSQDHISAFVSEKIVQTNNNSDKIKKSELTQEFKRWFEQEQGNRKSPKGLEVIEYVNDKFSVCKNNVWHGIKIIYQESSEDELDYLN